MKILKHIFVSLVFFISILNRKTHIHEEVGKIFHLNCTHNVCHKKKSDEYDEFVIRLNSLSKHNRNAVMVLLNSLYQQEVKTAQKEFTLITDKGCIKYRPLSNEQHNYLS